MNVLRLGWLTLAWVACCTIGACGGEESNGGAPGGAGGIGGGTSSGGSAGTGAAAGQTTGTGGSMVTSAECVASHFSGPGITEECKQCMCDCDAATASICNEDCWSLTRCVQRSCSSPTDLMCIITNCAAFLSGATAATPLTSCFTKCGPAQCAAWFLDDNPGDGGDGAAGGDSGGAAGSAAGGTPSGGATGSAGVNQGRAGSGGEGG